ncbi:MAG: sugar ABC transporter substrate-binding protein [Comamonas sp.]
MHARLRTPPSRQGSRIRTVLAAALVAATAFAASALLPGQAARAAEQRFDGQTLNVLLITSHQGAGQWLKKHFEAETGARINPVIVPYDEIGNKLALDQQSGANTIDVAAPWYVSIGDLADGGALLDLSDWIKGDAGLQVGDFIPSIYDPYTVFDGKRWGLPFDGDTHVLFYNKEILARNGFAQPPRTWDEYVAQARAITAKESGKGIYGNVLFGQKSPLILGASFANRLAGYGGRFLDDAGRPVINSPQAVAAAQSLLEAAKSAYPTPATTAFGEGNAAWYAGKAAFIENWTDLGVGSEIGKDSKVAGKWGVVTLPVGGDQKQSRASLVAGFTWVIAHNTKKEALAKAFIKWAASSKVNEQLLSADPQTGIDPNRVSSLESASYGKAYPDLQRVNRATLNGALAWPTGKNATRAAEVLTDELAKLIAGTGGTPQQTLDRVQAQWERLLRSR